MSMTKDVEWKDIGCGEETEWGFCGDVPANLCTECLVKARLLIRKEAQDANLKPKVKAND